MSNFNARFPPKPATKRSVFERQRAEAEAKRQRDEAETAAVYEDFVKSFDDGATGSASTASNGRGPGVFSAQQPPLKSSITIGSTGGRRHFSIPSSGPAGQRNSGPGSLGGGAGAGSGLTSDRQTGGSKLGTRLAFDDNQDYDSDEEGQTLDQSRRRRDGDIGINSSSKAAERAEEKAIAKPTVRLANMPPGTSPAAVKALIVGGSKLRVDGVRILPTSAAPTGTNTGTDRKAVTAIVTLAAETAASDIDAAVSALQNRYMGYGYYLNLHRHLSSAVVASSTALAASIGNTANSASAQPFGAKPVPASSKPDGPSTSSVAASRFAPPPSYHGERHGGFGHHGHHGYRGIPPPASYNSAGGGGVDRSGILHVPVRPPRDIKKLRMIHKVIEHVLDQGPEFEALLMSRPEVQREEKWAWIWDARSEAGVWYRYRLWETVSGLRTRRGQGKYMPLFEGSHAWKVPDNPLPYEFDTSLADLVSDSEYNSSDDSDDDEGTGNGNGGGNGNDGEDTFLNPLEKARLVHLLARLPTTLSKLRKGDIARVTAFAITHASRGADEIVDLIVSNVERPLAYTGANPNYERPDAVATASRTVGGEDATMADGLTATTATPEVRDTSGAQLVAIYVVSDILSSSATSGIRHAWRFRQLFEAALRSRKVFEGLGQLAEKLQWGRMRSDKWKRSIGLILGQWEGWSVFSAETQEYFVSSFENPAPLAKKKEKDENDKTGAAAGSTSAAAAAKKGRWKTVDTTAAAAATDEDVGTGFRPLGISPAGADAREGHDMREDGDGDGDDNEWDYRSEYTDDEALDLACMDEEDIDGEPMSIRTSETGETGKEGEAVSRYIDGTPLTADEIHALVGSDIVEMSEEGEIGSDDDDYDMSGLSESGKSNVEVDVRAEEIEGPTHRAPAAAPAGAPSNPTPAASQAAFAGIKSPATFQISGRADAPSTARSASRKRMRAADMFADSDPDEGV